MPIPWPVSNEKNVFVFRAMTRCTMEETTVTCADFPNGLTLPQGLDIQVSWNYSSFPTADILIITFYHNRRLQETICYLSGLLAQEISTVEASKALSTSQVTKNCQQGDYPFVSRSTYYPYPQFNIPLKWRHNERAGVSNHQPHDCLLNRLFKAQIKENIKAPRHWTLCGDFTGDRWIPYTKGQ